VNRTEWTEEKKATANQHEDRRCEGRQTIVDAGNDRLEESPIHGQGAPKFNTPQLSNGSWGPTTAGRNPNNRDEFQSTAVKTLLSILLVVVIGTGCATIGRKIAPNRIACPLQPRRARRLDLDTQVYLRAAAKFRRNDDGRPRLVFDSFRPDGVVENILTNSKGLGAESFGIAEPPEHPEFEQGKRPKQPPPGWSRFR
jgi:hypothetical protein